MHVLASSLRLLSVALLSVTIGGVVSAAPNSSPPLPPEAVRLKALAEQGDLTAAVDLGQLYVKGVGMARDPAEAARLFTLAARQDNARAQGQLSALHYFGDGVPRDYAEAVRLARLAADKGDPLGQVILGACYSGGAGGLARDEGQAARLYQLSADQNNGLGQFLLAGMYEKGRGVEKDPAEAFRLYVLAASQGTPQARAALARLAAIKTDGKSDAAAAHAGPLEVPLTRQSGVLAVPVVIGGSVSANFIVDSGASDVTVTEVLFQRLKQAGLIADSDFSGVETHQQADGSTFQARIFVIRSLNVGGKVLENVKASLAPGQGMPLLGQSFLRRFSSWSIDNGRQMLVLTQTVRR